MTTPLSAEQRTDLLEGVQARFEKNMHRHPDRVWIDIQEKLESTPTKLRSLYQMELMGGEPDIIGYDKKTGEYTFCDCSAESPKGRRSLCYDRNARIARKENKPESTVLDMAAEMGIDLLTEDQYRALQKLGTFDIKTSSWIVTPASIRDLRGVLFCDRRYDTIFTYHNGAESYYAARGFRGSLKV